MDIVIKNHNTCGYERWGLCCSSSP